MAINTSKLYNGNLYINGRTKLGQVKSLELPNLTPDMEEVEALGLMGRPEVPVGYAALEATITWNGPYADTIKEIANPNKAHQLMFRGSIDSYGPGGRIAQTAYVCTMTGTFKEVGLGSFEAKTGSEMETSIAVSAIKLEIGGETLMDIDVFANRYIVADEDILAQYRINIGQ